MVIHPITVGPFAMNCHLVYDEASRTGVVVDPGDEIDRIRAAIRERNLTITHILLTHGHIDHVAYAEDLHEELKVPMLLHPQDWQMARQVQTQAQMFGLPPCRVPVLDGPLEEGQVIESGPLRFEVLFTPGHSPGSVTLKLPGHALVGDVIFQGSIGRTDLPGGDLCVLMDTIWQKIVPLGDEVVLYPGHGPMTTVAEERRGNPFLEMYPAH